MPSISFRSVTMEIGSGSARRRLLDDLSWHIPAGSRYVILGQPGSGKSTLLDLISGARIPTGGWVERHALVTRRSLMGLVSSMTSPRKLIRILCNVYNASDDEVGNFVENFAEIEGMMDMPFKALPRQSRDRLAIGLFYGFPCDFYLFDERFKARNLRMKDKVDEAFLQRGRTAGMILATSNTRYVKEFGGTAGILYRGQLCFFDDVDEAIATFEQLPVDQPLPFLGLPPTPSSEDEEDEI